MIHNRKICDQIDMTDEDMDILLRLNVPIEPRHTDRRDYFLMCCREAGKARGYISPLQLQNSIFCLSK